MPEAEFRTHAAAAGYREPEARSLAANASCGRRAHVADLLILVAAGAYTGGVQRRSEDDPARRDASRSAAGRSYGRLRPRRRRLRPGLAALTHSPVEGGGQTG